MNTKNFTYLLENSQKIGSEDLTKLATIISTYSYFQSARALQLKGLKNENSYLYNDALKVAAAYTTDRNILFEYITSENFIQNEISQAIQQQYDSISDIKVVSEDISEKVSLEIDNQLKSELKKAEDILDPSLFERKKTSVEKVLEIDEPLQFTEKDTHSFTEWLKLSKATPIDRSSSEVKNAESSKQNHQERKFELIEKFIQKKPKLTKTSSFSENKDLAEPYTQASNALMTETLAKVYLQQKSYKKAIQAYKILILKNPEKSGFFADQIRAIQKLINTEES